MWIKAVKGTRMNWSRSKSRKSKYANQKSKLGGLTFDSKLESEHYVLLLNRLSRGEIRDLARQVKIELTSNAEKHKDKVHYVADFVFFDLELNQWVVWDSKGMPTDAYKIKRKWILDNLNGFLFIEHSKKEKKIYKPRGDTPLKIRVRE